MRLFCALTACVALGCASRSRLSLAAVDDAGSESDVARTVDGAPPLEDVFVETWSREAGGDICTARPSICLGGDDFGPSKSVRAVFEQCSGEVGFLCGDLALVVDAEGCVVAVEQISGYSGAFVECVVRVTGMQRWQCASGRTMRMVQQCAP